MDIPQVALSIATQAAAAAVTGRPALLTDSDLLTTLLTETLAGVHLEPAASIAGVDAATVKAWLKRGQQDEDAGIPSPRRSFLRAFKSAQATVEAQVTRNVVAASEKPQFWAAGMTYLERTHPERWGRAPERAERGTAAIEVHVHGIDRGQVVIGVAAAPSNYLANTAESDKEGYVNLRSPASVREIAPYSDGCTIPGHADTAAFAKDSAVESGDFLSNLGARTERGAPAPPAPAAGGAPGNPQSASPAAAVSNNDIVSSANDLHVVTHGIIDVPYLIEGLPVDPGGPQSKKKPKYKNPAAARRAELLHREAKRRRRREKIAKSLANAKAHEARTAKKGGDA